MKYQNLEHIQKHELTEYYIYLKLAKLEANEHNRQILSEIADFELKHSELFKKYTKKELKPDHLKILLYTAMAKKLGLNFTLRLLESDQKNHHRLFDKILKAVPHLENEFQKAEEKEKKLLDLLDNTELRYSSAVILGLNDALVELTGALAGFTLALNNTNLIGISGLIMGIAAGLSMMGTSYLQAREEDNSNKNPIKTLIYTGITYFTTVFFLIIPYFILTKPLIALSISIGTGFLIIYMFTFYISIAKNLNFKKRFLEMAIIFTAVTIINFLIGLGLRLIFNISA